MSAKTTLAALVGALAAVGVGAGIGAYVVNDRNTNDANQISSIKAADAARVAALDAPVTAGARADGSHYGSLFAYLLPTPTGWSPGPSVGSVGSNDVVSGSQINTELSGLLQQVPKSDMSSTQSTLAALHIQGAAVRSMVKSDHTMEVNFILFQLDPKVASSDQQSLKRLVDGFSFRQGASIPGYPSGACVLPPGVGSDTIESMTCVASYGDVEVIVQAEGQVPLDQNTTVKLAAEQLDRLKTSQTLTAASPDQGDQNE